MTASQSYLLFVAFAAVAIATPGPGVLLTVSNALRYGFARSFPGIVGLAIGMLGVGVLSGAGWGALLASSATAFTVAKYVGAAYLIYLGLTRLLGKRVEQLSLLAVTFSALMVVIHSAYCAVATAAKRKVLSERWTTVLNRTTGGLFVALGVGVAASTK